MIGPPGNVRGADDRAVSNRKCNGFIEGGHCFGHFFGGCFPAEGFSGAAVYQGCDVVEPSLAGIAEVGAFGHELAHFKREAIDPVDQSQCRRPLVFALLPRCQGA